MKGCLLGDVVDAWYFVAGMSRWRQCRKRCLAADSRCAGYALSDLGYEIMVPVAFEKYGVEAGHLEDALKRRFCVYDSDFAVDSAT